MTDAGKYNHNRHAATQHWCISQHQACVPSCSSTFHLPGQGQPMKPGGGGGVAYMVRRQSSGMYEHLMSLGLRGRHACHPAPLARKLPPNPYLCECLAAVQPYLAIPAAHHYVACATGGHAGEVGAAGKVLAARPLHNGGRITSLLQGQTAATVGARAAWAHAIHSRLAAGSHSTCSVCMP